MFRNPKKKTKKKSNWKKKSKKNSSCPSFIFALYTFISPSLQIILKKFTYLGRSQRVEPILRILKKLGVKPRNGTLTKTRKTTIVLLALKVQKAMLIALWSYN